MGATTPVICQECDHTQLARPFCTRCGFPVTGIVEYDCAYLYNDGALCGRLSQCKCQGCHVHCHCEPDPDNDWWNER